MSGPARRLGGLKVLIVKPKLGPWNTEALGTPLHRSGQHSGRPVAFHHDAGNLSQSEMDSAPPLTGQPMAACRDRKLFQPAGVSTDAQEVPVAEPAVLTGGGRTGAAESCLYC